MNLLNVKDEYQHIFINLIKEYMIEVKKYIKDHKQETKPKLYTNDPPLFAHISVGSI